MNGFFAAFIMFLFTTACFGMDRDRNELLEELDAMVKSRQKYMEIKEARIDSLRSLSNSHTDLLDQYRMNNLILDEYSTYRYDSAMHYVLKNQQIAEKLNIQKYKDEMTLHMTILLATAGMIKESMDNLKSIERSKLDVSLIDDYYVTAEWTYYTAKNYTNDGRYSSEYERLESMYVDSVYSVLPPGSLMHTYYEGFRFLKKGELDNAKPILLKLLGDISVDMRLYAIVASNLSTICREQKLYNDYEKYLILAAMSDQVCTLKENLAMQNLAIYLYKNKPKDIERAYRYIQCAMEDAQFYNSRFRTVQIAKELPVIVSAYQAKSDKEKNNLKVSLIIISILSLFMVVAIFYIYKQMRLVRRSRRILTTMNGRLNELNAKLSESNKTREEYVGLFMDLCSFYIDKLSQYMDTVKRKIKAKQLDDLFRISDSPKTIQREVTNFLTNFDEAFLHLYPTFVNEFNDLLTDEGKIVIKEGERLNTELRIFALIKLGISDSSKIAMFLHYSPQTIYNYRTKIKNLSKVDRDKFEDYVREIGTL